MADYLVTDTELTSIANAIRTKGGTSASLTFPTGFVSAINDIQTGITPTGTTGITPTGTKSISANGTYDVTQYASANVNVPNSYSQSDEGKVVSSGELVAQTSQTITENGTYDTTLVNSITINVRSVMERVVISGTAPTQELLPNKFYVFGECDSLTVTLGTITDQTIVNEYHFRFTSGATATTLTLPQTVTMPSDFQVEASKVYEISIIDNYGTVTSW